MTTICGIDSHIDASDLEKIKTYGGTYIASQCMKAYGQPVFMEYLNQLAEELHSLNLPDLPQVTGLTEILGSAMNLTYSFPNGKSSDLINDDCLYLGCKVAKPNSDRCYGILADDHFLLVCEFDQDQSQPELLALRKRTRPSPLP